MTFPRCVHLVGAQKSNRGWGFEHRIRSGLLRLGIETIETDFRLEADRLRERLLEPADLVLVCNGTGIPAEWIRSMEAPTVLWYAEQVGTWTQTDPLADRRRAELAQHGPAFDYVFSHDRTNLDVYRRLGCTRVGCLPVVAADPTVRSAGTHRPGPDVLFIGTATARRARLLEAITRHVPITTIQCWDPKELAGHYERARIVLNLHLSDLPNTETRIGEVLGAGGFLLSEALSMPELIEDGRHAAFFPPGDVAACVAKIEYYLAHEAERARIAAAGKEHVLRHHTIDQRLRTLFASVDLELKRRLWPGLALGVLRNKWGEPTMRLADFEAAVEDQLTRAGVPVAECQPDGTLIESVSEPSPLVARLRLAESGQSEGTATGLINQALAAEPKTRRPIRVFAAFANVNWEEANLTPALRELGEVVRFDWGGEFDQYADDWHVGQKQRMNEDLLSAVAKAHAEQPIDLFFSYLSGRLVFPGIIRAIGAMGIRTLNLCLDDRASFWGRLEPTGFSGMVDLAAAFDLCWTSTPEAVPWYASAGGRAVFLPPGADPKAFAPAAATKDLELVFIGQKYGVRPAILDALRAAGIRAQAFGKGWPAGELTAAELVATIARARVVLGIGTIGASEVLTLKGRDFEIPMAGACYLTQYNSELEPFFEIGREIACYRSREELITQARVLLSAPDRAAEMGALARARSLRDHTWQSRFEAALSAMEWPAGRP